jgi:hypothetical protein
MIAKDSDTSEAPSLAKNLFLSSSFKSFTDVTPNSDNNVSN